MYPISVTVEQGRELLLNQKIHLKTEYVAVEEAYGRVLAEDVISKENIPPFQRSPYDGYAFRAQDTIGATKESPVTLKIVEEIPAGKAPEKTINQNEAAKILTGAPLPEGADTIEMFEKTEYTQHQVTLFREYQSGSNVVPIGEDITIGMKICEKGNILSPSDIGLLAGLGFDKIAVFKKPNVAIISTGSELAAVGQELKKGQIRNSSSYTLKGYLDTVGADTVLKGIVKDDSDDIAKAILEAAKTSDLVITTGGVSVGDYDLVPEALEKIGARILCWKVKMKPGMAFVAAVYEGTIIIGLSGNPASAAISLFMLGLPVVRKLCGRPEQVWNPQCLKVKMKKGFPKGSPGRRYLPGKLMIDEEGIWIDLEVRQGNGMLNPLQGCDLLAEIPAGSPPIAEYSIVDAWKMLEQ